MEHHICYNVANYPRLVWARHDSGHHIYADARGNCAAIPVKPGYKASTFGNLAHVARCKRENAWRRGYSSRKIAAMRAALGLTS